MKKQQPKPKNSNFMLKVILPIVILFIIVGVIYWSSTDSSESSGGGAQMADGVAKFYASFRKNFGPGAQQLDDYTIKLPEPSSSVLEQLQQRAATVQPAEPDWQGGVERRSFKENDTIKMALEKFAEKEGIEIIWDLEYDYIIKNHFEENNSFKALVNRVSVTVNNDYDGQVLSYFCPQERAMVITAKTDQYLTDFCESTKSKRQQAIEKRRAEEYKLKKKLGLN